MIYLYGLIQPMGGRNRVNAKIMDQGCTGTQFVPVILPKKTPNKV